MVDAEKVVESSSLEWYTASWVTKVLVVRSFEIDRIIAYYSPLAHDPRQFSVPFVVCGGGAFKRSATLRRI